MKHHGAGLRRLLKNDVLAEAIERDYASAPITDAQRAMLDYSVTITRSPSAARKEDAERLKMAGFSDAAILDIVQVAAYYAFVNRIADGLGVELEPFWATEGKEPRE